jgi:hypothetical protein
MADQKQESILAGCTVYLSGPMDFLALPREEEARHSWRARVGQFLRKHGVNVLDPWHKPEIRALHDYGKEDAKSTENRDRWTFDAGEPARAVRAEICHAYWPTVHIDLRMVDKSDFLIAFCATNTYSVGTVHEIALARQQRKPVLFVSPPIRLDALADLQKHLAARHDSQGLDLLEKLRLEQPMKENLNGAPSLWYMGLLPGDYFFSNFGFDQFRPEYGWEEKPLDALDRQVPLAHQRSLLPYLEALDRQIPDRYDPELKCPVPNDDWLIFEKGRKEKVSQPVMG